MSLHNLLYLTPKATYPTRQEDIVRETRELHREAFSMDRELYTYLLYFLDSTYYSKGLIIQQLLTHSLNKPEHQHILREDPDRLRLEDELILRALRNETITHALKLLLTLKEQRINNARTTRLILRFLFERDNLDRIAIKYRQKLKSLLIHALGKTAMHHLLERTPQAAGIYGKFISPYSRMDGYELFDFLWGKNVFFRNPYFVEYLSVKDHFAYGTLHLLEPTCVPIEVVNGFNLFYKGHLDLRDLHSLRQSRDPLLEKPLAELTQAEGDLLSLLSTDPLACKQRLREQIHSQL